MEMTNANLLLRLLMQFLFIFLLNYPFRLAVRHQKAYIMHLGMPSLYSPQVGRGYFSRGMAENGKSEGGHVAAGKGEQKREKMRLGKWESTWFDVIE